MDHDSRDISKMRNIKQEVHEWSYPFISKLLLEIARYIWKSNYAGSHEFLYPSWGWWWVFDEILNYVPSILDMYIYYDTPSQQVFVSTFFKKNVFFCTSETLRINKTMVSPTIVLFLRSHPFKYTVIKGLFLNSK